MEHIATVDARNQFSELINRASYGKERIILTRHGKDIVAIIPIEDIDLLGHRAPEQDLCTIFREIRIARVVMMIDKS